MKVLKEFVIYQEKGFYSSFPGIAGTGDGRFFVVFRRSPNYNGLPGLPEGFHTHGDCLSQLMMVSSGDNGETWSRPRLLCSPPDGGSQDGGMFFDGKYLFANSFTWRFIPNISGEIAALLDFNPYVTKYMSYMACKGSYVMRSSDGGKSWDEPVYPDPMPGSEDILPGMPHRPVGRGNLLRAADGRLLLSAEYTSCTPGLEHHGSAVIWASDDDGASFKYYCTAIDDRGIGYFGEPSLYITPGNKWVIFTRCHRLWDRTPFGRAQCVYAYSEDEGRSWSDPVNAGFHAVPMATHRLDDGRCMLVYGYRKEDGCGVRMRVCNPELTDIETAPEEIICSDNGHPDCGYPNVASMGDGKYLIAYYKNKPEYNGTSAIWGAVVEIK